MISGVFKNNLFTFILLILVLPYPNIKHKKIKPYQRKCVKINEIVVVVSTVAMIVTGCATVSAINDMEKQIETDHDHMKGNAEYFNI